MMNMLEYVVSELGRTEMSYVRLQEATGVPKSTIQRIATGETQNPGIRHLEALYGYFHNMKRRAS